MPGRTVRLAFSIALVLLSQGVARAAPRGWEGTLSLDLLVGNPSFQVQGGGVASVNASSGGLPAHLSMLRLAGSRHNLSLAESGPLTDPDVPVPTSFGLTGRLLVTASLGTGTVSGISGAAASTGSLGARELPLRGLVRFGELVPGFATAPLPTTAPLTWVTVNGASAGVGVGGGYVSRNTIGVLSLISTIVHGFASTSVPHLFTVTGHEIRWVSVLGAPWTIKTATASAVDPPIFRWSTDQPPPPVVTATRRGFAHAPVSTTTSTVQVGGMLQMVTPMQVRSYDWRSPFRGSGSGSGWAAGGFGVLTIRFIPEPGVGLLLATGLAGLVAVGRQRMRK